MRVVVYVDGTRIILVLSVVVIEAGFHDANL
jgi:hypothetical protein